MQRLRTLQVQSHHRAYVCAALPRLPGASQRTVAQSSPYSSPLSSSGASRRQLLGSLVLGGSSLLELSSSGWSSRSVAQAAAVSEKEKVSSTCYDTCNRQNVVRESIVRSDSSSARNPMNCCAVICRALVGDSTTLVHPTLGDSEAKLNCPKSLHVLTCGLRGLAV